MGDESYAGEAAGSGVTLGLLGATSRLGTCTREALEARGAQVVLLKRAPAAPERSPSGAHLRQPEERALDLLDPATHAGALEGIDVLISVAGAPVTPYPRRPRVGFEAVDRDGHAALAAAARAQGVRRAVYVSVFGDDITHLRYVRAHREAEDAFRATGMEFCALRPVGLFGAFDLLLPFARRGLAFNVAGGRALTNPVSERDLAAILVEQALAARPEPVVDVGGPEVLSRRAIWDLLFQSLGRRGLHLPSFAFGLRALACALNLVDARAADVTRFLAHALSHDEVAPQRGTRRLSDHFDALVASKP